MNQKWGETAGCPHRSSQILRRSKRRYGSGEKENERIAWEKWFSPYVAANYVPKESRKKGQIGRTPPKKLPSAQPRPRVRRKKKKQGLSLMRREFLHSYALNPGRGRELQRNGVGC